ncbi:MAG: hypothetical protein IPK13_27415 [Deltaproteobacteria bacterium]|nr:hypothetical protein [Deltaproteobacteria bacterium]
MPDFSESGCSTAPAAEAQSSWPHGAWVAGTADRLLSLRGSSEWVAPSSDTRASGVAGIEIRAAGSAAVQAARIGARPTTLRGAIAGALLGVLGLGGLASLAVPPALAATQAPRVERRGELFESSDAAKKPGPRELDRILMLGMNLTASVEAEAMRRGGDEVLLIDPTTSTNGFVVYGSRKYDLSRMDEGEALGRALGLDPARARLLATVFERRDIKARDELARLAIAFAESENGTRVFGRLVLSGHSMGDNISGTDNGEIRLHDVETLAEIFPRAAAGIEDVKLAACETGSQANHSRLFEYFRNLRTSTAFDGRGALAKGGGAQDLARWARATRGRIDRLDRNYARGLWRGNNISVHTRARGFETHRPALALPEALAAYEDDRADVEAYSQRGAENSAWTTKVRLTAHYDAIQALLRCVNIPANLKASIEAARDHVVRLRHEKEIVVAFVRNFSADLKSAYDDLGATVPKLEQMTRRARIEHIQTLERVSTSASISETTRRFIERMRATLIEMTPEAVPFDWI